MSAEHMSDLYRELALGRAREAIEALRDTGAEQLIAQSAATLEEAAGALACITAAYTSPDGELATRWQTHITELVAIAASLEQLADATRHHHL